MNHPRAGRLPELSDLVDLSRLVSDYYSLQPDPSVPEHLVAFGTSGHRGSSSRSSFNEAHIVAVVQATCEARTKAGVRGPMFVGKDTHALSEPAWRTAVEVLVAHGVDVLTAAPEAYVPTPAVSRAIVTYNRSHADAPADGLIITPSHNPPADGGIKYNPPHGGPSDSEVSGGIQARANALIQSGEVTARIPFSRALAACRIHDFMGPYVEDLASVVDVEAIRSAGLRLGAHPLGGSSVDYWEPIAERYGLQLEVVDPQVDGTFRFMPLDHDGKIRMDCSSRFAMATLVELRDRFDVAFGNDADADRHGIVTPKGSLLNPNHVLSLAVDYLFGGARPEWKPDLQVGKTLVSSQLVSRVAEAHGRRVAEVPVGFKWFVEGLLEGRFGFAGEESAGATLLDRQGRTWTTDKDGIVLDLLAAEMTARRGKDLAEQYHAVTERHGAPVYRRIDAPASPAQKKVLKNLEAGDIDGTELAGYPILHRRTRAPGNDAAIGGLQVVTSQGWFAARPSGTEDIYKVYAESFDDEAHLNRLLEEAQRLVGDTFTRAGV